MVDYHADVRCSKEIIKQLSQNYLKFRNTARYCLGNLSGFDPNHLVAPADMEELDKWALTKLNDLILTCRKAYENYEFHVVSHEINDFCVVELSSFYLDIIKDRLYCEDANGLRRRSAQTALYLIVDAMAKLFAPILAFTCDEIWQAMPHRDGDDTRNILLNQMPTDCAAYVLPEAAMAKWETVMKLRQDVNGTLEIARSEKRIGKALEAHVSLEIQDKALKAACEGLNLAEIFIVSSCDWEPVPENATTGTGSNLPGLTIGVTEARGTKCPRCWMHSTEADENGLCPRCAGVPGNTYSIPLFSILLSEEKSLAVSSCRFNQSFPKTRKAPPVVAGGASFVSVWPVAHGKIREMPGIGVLRIPGIYDRIEKTTAVQN